MNRFATMLRAGVTLGGGSDSTVTPLDPFLALAALRSHTVAEESLAPEDALAVLTTGVAALAPDEGLRGSLDEGHRGDLVWLDRDPLEAAPDELLATEVLGTWVAGERVWPAEEAEVR
jgi:predicted amidohydrolase YtcJ